MKNIYSKQEVFDQDLFRPAFLIGIIFSCFMLLSNTAVGYDFSDARKSLVKDLMTSAHSSSNGRLAIVYHVENRAEIQNRYDLVQLKKDLAYEMVKSFQVTDPVIVQEIMETNHLTFQQLLDDRVILEQFTRRADCSQILFVRLAVLNDRMMVDMKLLAANSQQISQINMEIAPESKGEGNQKTRAIVSSDSQSDRSIFQSFKLDFVPKIFPSSHNDSWLYFSPTALLIPEMQSFDLFLWLKHLREVDIRPVHFRYAVKLFKVLQLGLQTYAITEKESADVEAANLLHEQGHHSTYISLQYQIADDSSLPVNLMLGVRRRVIWDNQNTDYRTRDSFDATTDTARYEEAKELDKKNDQYNQLTLTAAITGKVEQFGLFYNFYLDNQVIGTGAKFLLTSNIKLMADSVFYYYEKAQIPSDFAFGIELYSQIGSTSLIYQLETDQIQLGLSFDF